MLSSFCAVLKFENPKQSSTYSFCAAVDCADTTSAAIITLEGVRPCEVGEGTVEDVWHVDMIGHSMQRAAVVDTNFSIDVTIAKAKDFGQSLRNFTLTNITRALPTSPNATCSTEAEVPLSNAVLQYASYNMYANLTLLLDQSVYCDPPPRGARRAVELAFTYIFYFDFEGENNRRRRRTVSSRQTITALGTGSDSLVQTAAMQLDVYHDMADLMADSAPSVGTAAAAPGLGLLLALVVLQATVT
jgi:hypothetical protein